MQLTPNFTLAELLVTSTGIENTPNREEVERLRALCVHVLQPLRNAVGPVVVNSGFRSARVNRAVGGSATSQHRLGEAADVRVAGMSSRQLAKRVIALGLPFDQLIVYPGSTRVHLSHGPRRRGQVLTAVHAAGRTTYRAGL